MLLAIVPYIFIYRPSYTRHAGCSIDYYQKPIMVYGFLLLSKTLYIQGLCCYYKRLWLRHGRLQLRPLGSFLLLYWRLITVGHQTMLEPWNAGTQIGTLSVFCAWCQRDSQLQVPCHLAPLQFDLFLAPSFMHESLPLAPFLWTLWAQIMLQSLMISRRMILCDLERF